MASNRDNIVFEKTSFLQGSNSPFIKELYLKYLENPKNIPQSWREIFDGLNEDKEAVQNEILGPSWAPKKNNTIIIQTEEKDLTQNNLSIDHNTIDLIPAIIISSWIIILFINLIIAKNIILKFEKNAIYNDNIINIIIPKWLNLI